MGIGRSQFFALRAGYISKRRALTNPAALVIFDECRIIDNYLEVGVASEFHEDGLVSMYLSGLKKIDEKKGHLQHSELFLHPTLGKVLIINKEIQHIENFQCIYHEVLTHLPMSFIPSTRKVLILGGGSLFAAYEVLKYAEVEKVILCDHAPEIINMMRQHYQHANEVIMDNRFYFIQSDCIKYINNVSDSFDLIINDCFDIALESEHSTQSLFDKMYKLLTINGVCSDIIYRHIHDQLVFIKNVDSIKKFHNYAFSLVSVPEYPGILHLAALWGKNANLRQNAKKIENGKQKIMYDDGKFEYFNPYYLDYYLYIPQYLKNIIIKTDEKM